MEDLVLNKETSLQGNIAEVIQNGDGPIPKAANAT
jgi:hypothetical protein